METIFLNNPSDCEWLRSTHLKTHAPVDFQSFVIYGNEDAPDKIELFASADPLNTDQCLTINFIQF